MSVLCIAGQTFTFSVRVEDQANAGKWMANPTIAAGDFQRSINGAGYVNLDNIPTVTPAAGVRVQIVLSAAETTAAGAGGVIDIDGIDAAGAEWYDVTAQVRVATRDIDDLAFPNTSGRGIDVDASGGVEVGAFQNDTITAASIATDAIDADSVAADAANKIADHTIRRSFANANASTDGDAKSFRSLLGAIAKLVNYVAVSSNILTVYEEDDATSLGTQTITTDAEAAPITAANTN